MGSLSVTTAELDRVTAQLHAAVAAISGDSALSLSLVNQVARDGWQGAASGQFIELFTQWKTSSDQLLDALTRIAGLLSAASEAYASTEDSVRRSMEA